MNSRLGALSIFALLLFSARSSTGDEPHKDPNIQGPKGYPAVCSSIEAAQFLTLADKMQKEKSPATSAELVTLGALFKKIPRHCLDSKRNEQVEAVARFYQLAPCDLKNIRKKIQVKLSSEDHGDRSAELIRGYYAKADANQINLLFEAYLDRIPEETSNEYKSRQTKARRVVDGESTVGFASCIILADQWNPRKSDPIKQATRFVAFLADPRIFEQVVKSALGTPQAKVSNSSAKVQEFYRILSHANLTSVNLVNGKAKDPRFKDEEAKFQTAQINLNDFAKSNPKVIEEAWHAIRDYWIGRVTSETEGPENITAPSATPEKLRQALDGDKASLNHLARLFLWEARERNEAYQVLKEICASGNGELSPGEIVLHMGAGHVPFVLALINAALKNSGAVDKVQVQVDMPTFHGALTNSGDHETSDDLGARPNKDLWKFLRDLPPESAFRDGPQYRVISDYFKKQF